MAEFKSTISSQNFDKALQGGLDYAADKSGIQEALKELSAKGFVYIGPDQPTDGTMYWLDTSADEPDVPDEPDIPVEPDDPDVPVVPDNPDEPVYALAAATDFDRTGTLDTGYALCDEDKDWTVVSAVSGAPGYGAFPWLLDGKVGMFGRANVNWSCGYAPKYTSNDASVLIATGTATNLRSVITHKTGEETLTVYYVSDGKLVSSVASDKTYSSIIGGGTVHLGGKKDDSARYWTGTINDFKIYERVLTEAEIEAYMGAAQAPDLTSISATYSGGDVAVGTALTELTGIVVTATYSDGSTATVTGYTLSGTIAEGSNTITVTYEGKTDTFTVTGVAVEDEDADELMRASNIVLANHTIEKNTAYDFYQLNAKEGANVYEIPVEAGATYELSVYYQYSGTPQWGNASLAGFNDNLSGVIAEKLTNFETVGSRINGYDFVASDRDTNVVQTPVATGGYKNTITMTPTIDGYFYCDDRNVVANGYPAMSVKKVVS